MPLSVASRARRPLPNSTVSIRNPSSAVVPRTQHVRVTRLRHWTLGWNRGTFGRGRRCSAHPGPELPGMDFEAASKDDIVSARRQYRVGTVGAPTRSNGRFCVVELSLVGEHVGTWWALVVGKRRRALEPAAACAASRHDRDPGARTFRPWVGSYVN